MSWALANKSRDVDTLLTERGRINLRPEYQRRLVWNYDTRQHLIWCILHGQDIPKFYFHVRDDKLPLSWDVVDGQQRIDAIFRFIDNKLRLSKKAPPIMEIPVAGKRFCDLPIELRSAFLRYSCLVAEIVTDEEDRVIDQFLALQFGKPLNGQERRQARPGFVSNLVAELGQHSIIEISNISHQRAGGLEAVSRLVLWEMNGQISESRAHHLDKLYIKHANDSLSDPEWRRIKSTITKTFDLMERIFPVRHPKLSNITMFMPTYWLMRHLMNSYVIDDAAMPKIRDWFDLFVADLQERQRLEGHQDIRRWSGAMSRRSLNQEHFDYLAQHFFANVTAIRPKDPQRKFTVEQRYTIWQRAGGQCQWVDKQGQMCNIALSYEAWDADHITPHNVGGETTVENGRVLCPFRNRSRHKAGECPHGQA